MEFVPLFGKLAIPFERIAQVVLDKKDGCIRRILFTPDDLEAFRNALLQALARFRKGGGKG